MKTIKHINCTSKTLVQSLVDLAAEHMTAVRYRGDLEVRRRDELDFLEVPVWGLKAALIAAYRLGVKDAQRGCLQK